MQAKPKAQLVLENGMVFEGTSFGYNKSIAGEVVFVTAMTGYTESLTDPSYTGQILTFTFPLIGNYGVPSGEVSDGISAFWESERIHTQAIVVADYSEEFSHWNAQRSLSEWLHDEKVVGITGIDTRQLTKVLRETGAMKGKIIINEDIDFIDPNAENLVAKASCRTIEVYGKGKHKVVLVDCGVKHNIIRCLLKRDTTVIRVPWNHDFTGMEFDGLFISNGPGNPDHAEKTVQHIRKALELKKPIFGICMGNQLLAKAAGATTYKLKYGHRSHNQPVRMVGTDRCFVTSQNHGYAVKDDTMAKEWEPLFINMNDGTNEGIRHKTLPYFSAQFHPEAASGPTDTEFLFDDFIKMMEQK